MKKLRCQPGDRCVIVADLPGCEGNIGAQVTVTRQVPLPHWISDPAWEFKDASRPLKFVGVDVTTQLPMPSEVSWTSSTGPLDSGEYCGVYDRHLVPLNRPQADDGSNAGNAIPITTTQEPAHA